MRAAQASVQASAQAASRPEARLSAAPLAAVDLKACRSGLAARVLPVEQLEELQASLVSLIAPRQAPPESP